MKRVQRLPGQVLHALLEERPGVEHFERVAALHAGGEAVALGEGLQPADDGDGVFEQEVARIHLGVDGHFGVSKDAVQDVLEALPVEHGRFSLMTVWKPNSPMRNSPIRSISLAGVP